MPKKTPEDLREEVVALRKRGTTYNQIEKTVINPETGKPISRPTLIKILKEAGLTRPKGASVEVVTTPAASSAGMRSTGASMPALSSSDGVSEFMPAKPPVRTTATKAEAMEFECDSCGAEFIADSEDDLPDACPECGQ